MALAVDWGFDAKGNALPPVLHEWSCQIGGVVWTPENWQDYMELYNKFGFVFDGNIDQPTLFSQASAVEFSSCCEWAMDAADPFGHKFGSRSFARALGQKEPIRPAIPGRSIVPYRVIIWPPT